MPLTIEQSIILSKYNTALDLISQIRYILTEQVPPLNNTYTTNRDYALKNAIFDLEIETIAAMKKYEYKAKENNG